MRVRSLRKVDWGSLRANFFVLLPVSELPDDVAYTWMAAWRSPGQPGFDNALVRQFPNITSIDMSATLAQVQRVLAQENVPAEAAALRLLARAARGSMRDALSLTDQAIAFAGGQGVQEAAVRQMLGSVNSSHVLGLIDALAQGDAARIMAGVQALQTPIRCAPSALPSVHPSSS